jgi:thioredoxin reductase (NADPH)
VAVVGGGDTAMEDALYLSRLCNRVYVIHRRERFRAAAGLVKKIQSQKNIECIMKSRVREITGGLTVNGVLLETPEGERNLPVEGVFIAVGVRPKTELLKGLVEMDEAGYVIAGENCVTNCTGVFAAGDIRKKPLRQIVTAVADGANSVGSVVSYLE